ncbi:MAG: tandem-95 repeat protein, partial [Novosphingobium sp.]|nr:tandem-95 repeat protein [Novosphingobium sp.]
MKNIIVIDKNSGSVKSVENVRTLSSDRASVFLMKLPPESVESFKRDGDDLVIVLKNGQTIIISDFFMKYADGKPVDSVAEEAARNDEEDDRDQDHEDIERNELILEDDEGVAWWGQYPEQWSEFHFTEIEWGDGGGAMLPIILGALGVVGLGAVAAGGGGNSGDNQSVTPPPVTVEPEDELTAEDDTNTTSEDTPVSGSVAGNDSTTSGGTLTFAKDSDPANGTVTVNPDGTYTYTPDDNFNGEDSFTYTVTDEETGESLTRTVTITVGAESDLTAQDDTNTTSEDTPVSGSVAGNDSTTSGGTLTFAKESDPANGTVTVNPDGTYTYTPDDNFNGEDSFTYTVTDEETGESLTRT